MNLLELVQAQFPETRLARLASVIDESAAGTRQAFTSAALPAVLHGLSGEYAGEAGATRLLGMLRAGGHDGSLLPNLDGALAGGAQTDALLNLGKGQLGMLLGDRVDAVSELMTADTGIRRNAATALLALLVPVTLGVLGKPLQSGDSTTHLAELLAGVRAALPAVAAPGLAAALGVERLDAPPARVAANLPGAPRQGAAWPWLIVPAVTLAMFFSLRSCQQNSLRTGDTPVRSQAEQRAQRSSTAPATALAPAKAAEPAPAAVAMPPTPAVEAAAAPLGGGHRDEPIEAGSEVPAAALAPGLPAPDTTSPR